MLVRLTSAGVGNKGKSSNERLTEQQVCEPMWGIQFVTWLNSLFHDFMHNLLVKDRKWENTFAASGYSVSNLLLDNVPHCIHQCRYYNAEIFSSYWAGRSEVRFPAGVKRLFSETFRLAVGPRTIWYARTQTLAWDAITCSLTNRRQSDSCTPE
jgi:hypothetical protein